MLLREKGFLTQGTNSTPRTPKNTMTKNPDPVSEKNLNTIQNYVRVVSDKRNPKN